MWCNETQFQVGDWLLGCGEAVAMFESEEYLFTLDLFAVFLGVFFSFFLFSLSLQTSVESGSTSGSICRWSWDLVFFVHGGLTFPGWNPELLPGCLCIYNKLLWLIHLCWCAYRGLGVAEGQCQSLIGWISSTNSSLKIPPSCLE